MFVNLDNRKNIDKQKVKRLEYHCKGEKCVCICPTVHLSIHLLSSYLFIFLSVKTKRGNKRVFFFKNYPTAKCASIHPTIYPSIYSIHTTISQSKEMSVKEKDVLSNIFF